jgi:aspartyl-tRNA(Asn)/glutamyl-tRNA(Gln) amidotransferase subunit C
MNSMRYDLRVPAELTPDAVKHLARLARLELTPEELALYTRQLADILAYAEQVLVIDTAGVPPTSHPTGAAGRMRDDLPQPSLPRDVVLAQAPEPALEAGLFKVPRVLGS